MRPPAMFSPSFAEDDGGPPEKVSKKSKLLQRGPILTTMNVEVLQLSRRALTMPRSDSRPLAEAAITITAPMG